MNELKLDSLLPNDWLLQPASHSGPVAAADSTFYPVADPSVELTLGLRKVSVATESYLRALLAAGPRFLLTSDLEQVPEIFGDLGSKQFVPLFVRVKEFWSENLLTIEGRWIEGAEIDARFMVLPGSIVYRMVFSATGNDYRKYRRTANDAMNLVIRAQTLYAESTNRLVAP